MALYELAPDNVISVQIVGQYLGQRIIYSLHYYLSSLFTYADGPAGVRSLCSLVQENFWNSLWKSRTSSFYTLDWIQGQVVHPVYRVYERVNVGEAGTDPGTNPLPSNTSAIVSRSGSIAGRGRNSAIHLCGIDSTKLDDGFWTAGFESDLEAVGDFLKNVQNDPVRMLDFSPIIWSRQFPTALNAIRSCDASSIPRTERRRTVGRGV